MLYSTLSLLGAIAGKSDAWYYGANFFIKKIGGTQATGSHVDAHLGLVERRRPGTKAENANIVATVQAASEDSGWSVWNLPKKTNIPEGVGE